MATYPWQRIFSDFGKLVKTDIDLDGFIQTLEARTVEIQDHFDRDVYDSDYQADVLSSLGSFRDYFFLFHI